MIDVVVPVSPPDTDLANITVGPFGGIVDGWSTTSRKTSSLRIRGARARPERPLDPSTLLSGLDLGNLGGLLDPSTLLGDLTSLLPGLAADVPAQLATDLATLIPF